MSKNFDFKGRLAGNNFGQQMNTQAATVVSTLAGRTSKDSGWAKKFQVLDIPLAKLHELPGTERVQHGRSRAGTTDRKCAVLRHPPAPDRQGTPDNSGRF